MAEHRERPGHMNPQNLILIVAMMAAFWFLLIRPQQQRQKKQAAMLAGLKPGSEIVTIGGIYGTIVEVGDRVRLSWKAEAGAFLDS